MAVKNGKSIAAESEPAAIAPVTNEAASREGDAQIKTKFEAYTGDEPYLFVSYSHRDVEQVYPILDALHDRKYRIWYDESCENGNDFREELRTRIQESEAILLFVSASSMASPYCGMEVIVACECGKRLFPIYLDDAVVPPAFELLLANTHHSTTSDMNRLMRVLVRDLPAVTMDRLTTEAGCLKRCEDNGRTITVDEGIVVVCEGAFKNRKALHNIYLPNSLEKIEIESFRGCASLEEIVIPEHVKKIEESAFRDCISMKSLRILSQNNVKIGERAFENCVSIKNIELPDMLMELYGGVFNSCKSLRRIRLPQKLTILGESAFSDCVGLEEISIPETVTKIDDLAFNGCTSLSSVTLHRGLKKIGKSAFKNCKSLVNMDIPETVTSIDTAVFRGCEAMRSIRVDSRNKYYKSSPNKREGSDHVLFNKNKSLLIAYPASSREVQYDIPDSVTVISDWAFSECKKLSRITIPDTVREIGEGAFCNCILLDEVEIPDSVEKLDDCVFRGCTSLERVTIPASVTDIGWGLFDGCEKSVTVFCDENSEIQKYCIRNGICEKRINEKEGL